MTKITRLNYFKYNNLVFEKEQSIFDFYFEKLNFSSVEEYLSWCSINGFSINLKRKRKNDYLKELKFIHEQKYKDSLVKNNKSRKIKKSTDFIERILNTNILEEDLLDIKDEIYNYEKKEKGFISFLINLNKASPIRSLIFSKNEKYQKISKIMFLFRIFINKPLWINDLSSFNIEGRYSYKNYINHFFIKYNDYSSDLLYKLWWEKEDYYMYHINISQGYSLYKEFNKYFPDLNFTKKEILFSMTNFNNSIEDFIIKNLVKKYNGSTNLLKRIKKYSDIQNYIKEGKHYKINKVFEEFIELISKNETFFDITQLFPLWDYIKTNNISSIKGRSIFNLYNEMIEWHERLYKGTNLKFKSWDSFNDIKSYYLKIRDNNGNEIIESSITEILNNVDLKEEGKNMSHCVFSYLNNCQNGSSSIFSLKRKSLKDKMKRVLTIQVRNGVVVQVRGKYNSMPKKYDLKIIKDWARENQLGLGRYI